MNDEYIKTLVMDMAPEVAKDDETLGGLTEQRAIASDDHREAAAAEFKFTQKYSFLT